MALVNLANAVALRAIDSNGDPVSGALLNVYEAGTTTRVSTFTDEDGATPNADQVVGNAAGAFDDLGGVYLASQSVKIDITTSTGTSLPGYPIDDVFVGKVETALSTRSAISTSSNLPDAIRVASYSDVSDGGDGGHGLYIKVNSEPGDAAKVQSADSDWFRLVPENGGFLAEQFGAVGDGTTDDTTAITNLIAAAKAQNCAAYLTGGKTYLTDGQDLGSDITFKGIGGNGERAILSIKDNVSGTIGLVCESTKSVQISNINVDMSNVTTNCCAILWNGVWNSRIDNVKLIGPGGTDPSSGQVSYGLVMRSLYQNAYTAHSQLTALDALRDAAFTINFGTYYNVVTGLDTESFGYGIIGASREEDSSPSSRANQNTLIGCRNTSNWFGVTLRGIGGGWVLIGVNAENCGGDGYSILDASTGNAPLVLAGEVTADGDEYVGPGLILNGAGFTQPTANADNELATHIRASGNTASLFGRGFSPATILESEYNGVATIAATTGVFDINTVRSDFGSNAKYLCQFVVQGAEIAEDIIMLATGTSGDLTLHSTTQAKFGSGLQWQITGDILQIANTSGTERTVEYSVTTTGFI